MAREVSNPRPTIVGFYIWQDVDDDDEPSETVVAEQQLADVDA